MAKTQDKGRRLILAFVLFFSFEARSQHQQSTQEIFIHPFQNTSELSLTESLGTLSLHDPSPSKTLIDFLAGKIDSDIAIHIVPNEGMNLAETFANSDALTFQFSKEGIPLCLSQVRAVSIGKTLTLFGELPQLGSSGPLPESPDLSKSLESVWSYLKNKKALQNQALMEQKLCLFSVDNTLKPVWEMTVRNDGLSYKVWADEQTVYKIRNRFFDLVSAKFQTYARDPVTNKTTSLFREDINTGGMMTNDAFITDPSTKESGIARAKETTNEFIYDPSDKLFNEASIFVHANEHYSYFKSLGYSWTGPGPLILKFHTLVGDTKNNALYQPSDDNSQPVIMVGDGDGIILQNLVLDGDVVSHEFGHHIIFRNIQETSGESLVLHEGMADYFVFARNNDPCLGRSICVESSQVCIVPNQCLRIASKTLQYNSELYNKFDAHFQSQLVSGFLYGLHNFIDPKIVPEMVYKAIGLLVSNSGFKHLMIALLLVDYDMNKGVNACKIYEYANSRGFDTFTSDINCSKLESIKLLSNLGKSQVTTKRKKRSFLGCSGFSGIPAEGFDATIFFLFIPYVLRRRFRSENSKSDET